MNSEILKITARLLYFLAFLGVLPGTMKEQSFEITNLQINTGKLENPIKLVQISDLHLHEYGTDNIDLVEAVRNEAPDLIAITGDMMNKTSDEYASVLTLCRQLTEIAPVYYVYGNHEYDRIRKTKIPIGNDLTAIGVNLLDGEWRTIEVNGNRIDIAGISHSPKRYTKSDREMMDSYMQSPNFRLLLVHDPGFFDTRYTTNPNRTLIGKPIDVALCGHRHGGQIGIPYVGGLFMPDVGFFPDLVSGATRVENTWVVVSRGLGVHNNIPRINDPFELVSLEIR